MLNQRRRGWSNLEPTLGQCIVLTGVVDPGGGGGVKPFQQFEVKSNSPYDIHR